MEILVLFVVGLLSIVFWKYVVEPRLNIRLNRDIFVDPKTIRAFIKQKETCKDVGLKEAV